MKKRKSKRIVAVALGLVIVLTLLAACGSGSDSGAGSGTVSPTLAGPQDVIGGGETGVVTLPEDTEIDDDTEFLEHVHVIVDNNVISVLNPISPAAAGTSTNWVFTMIHDRLLALNADGIAFDPALALTYATDDFKTYTFTLREGVTFHNGDPFTADDVVWTVNKVQADGLGSSAYDQWRSIVSATALDSHTVEFVLDDVDVDFLYGMTRPMSGILNRRAFEENPETGSHIGTGAYTVEEFMSGDFARLRRNPNYWRTDNMPVTEIVTFRFVPEMPTRTVMMQTGDAHVSFGTPPGDMDWFVDSDDFTVFTTTSNDPQGLAFNLANPITGDINFRKAVIYGLDRVAIGFGAAGPWADGNLTDGTFWGYTTQFRNTDIPKFERDLDRAKEYLAQSSYNGEVVTITTAIMTNIMASQIIQAQLLEVGINTELNEMDTAGLGASTVYGGTEHQIVQFFYLMTPNAGSVRHSFVPGGGQNRANFDYPEVTELLNRARVTIDIAERERIYREVQELVYETYAYDSIFWRRFGNVSVNGLGGILLNPDPASHDFRGVYVIAE